MLEALILSVIHWFADFVLQTDKQAKNKSKSWKALLSHTLSYSLFVGIVTGVWLGVVPGLIFALVSFVAHTWVDYFTSRLNSRLWEKGEVHWFFVSIGFDQVLHYVQLFLTYYLLTK